MSINQTKEEFSNRLNEVLDDKGYSERGRAQRLKREGKFEVTDRAINKWLSAESLPEHKNIETLSNLLGVNFNWLAAGQGEKNTPLSIEDLRAKMDDVVNKNKGESQTIDGHVIAKPIATGMMPVISWVAAGSFTDIDSVTLEDLIDEIPRFPDMSSKAFGLIIKGRSMSPLFNPNDVIYVEPEVTPWDLKDGDLIVVQCNDGKEATFKQLIIGDTSEDMYLKPLNPDWHEQKIIPMGECTLVGIVKHSTRSY